jgi:parvulin-like peptidyl-prolyl isomerase
VLFRSLLAAAWALKVGDFTKPIQGVPGWYILKVNDRRPARFTFFGSRPNVLAELTRRRQEAILAQLRANVTLEK